MPWGSLVSGVLQRARAARRLHLSDEETGTPAPADWMNGKAHPTSPERLLPLASMVQKWRSAVQHSHTRGETGALVAPDGAVDAGENGEVCLVIKSPYRILREPS
ncbi:uncharacterized protein LOC122386799 [Amphibalanus amphitrite]|uniref:uncharacterized protein LOC122386799 n=1 Tax=Amphibalanus amphitrite TaxID=1232801 RepID=UPI001C90432F|nr:uncharacterized protein LOC122386799 [Amphibalanus amphitrite]